MSATSSRRVLGLLGGGLCLALLLLWVVLPLLEYREREAARALRAQRQTLRIQHLADQLLSASSATEPMPSQASGNLFALIQQEAARAGLERHLETLRPLSAERGEGGQERLELRMRPVYLEQGLGWLAALEQQAVVCDSLTLQRTPQGLLRMDMVLSAGRSHE